MLLYLELFAFIIIIVDLTFSSFQSEEIFSSSSKTFAILASVNCSPGTNNRDSISFSFCVVI